MQHNSLVSERLGKKMASKIMPHNKLPHLHRTVYTIAATTALSHIMRAVCVVPCNNHNYKELYKTQKPNAQLSCESYKVSKLYKCLAHVIKN